MVYWGPECVGLDLPPPSRPSNLCRWETAVVNGSSSGLFRRFVEPCVSMLAPFGTPAKRTFHDVTPPFCTLKVLGLRRGVQQYPLRPMCSTCNQFIINAAVYLRMGGLNVAHGGDRGLQRFKTDISTSIAVHKGRWCTDESRGVPWP